MSATWGMLLECARLRNRQIDRLRLASAISSYSSLTRSMHNQTLGQIPAPSFRRAFAPGGRQGMSGPA